MFWSRSALARLSRPHRSRRCAPLPAGPYILLAKAALVSLLHRPSKKRRRRPRGATFIEPTLRLLGNAVDHFGDEFRHAPSLIWQASRPDVRRGRLATIK